MNKHTKNIPSRIILWGGTGQAKVVRQIIEHYGSKVVAVFDDTPNLPSPFPDVPLYFSWIGFQGWLLSQDYIENIGFCITIGNPHGRVRLQLHDQLSKEGLQSITIIHPTAWIADNATIEEGAQIMAGAIIQPEVKIGRQCIINTKVSIDHECILEDGVEISPGATLCGNVYVETNSWICAGAIILPRIKIGHDAIIGAGSLVTKNIPNNTLVYGVPARIVRKVKGV
jgi:sugar O-acyltransferase (sialic acid O-acetyltransferase NeuD family)